MNYEELLENRDARALRIAKLPLGVFYKQLVGKKYANVVKFRFDLTDNVLFDSDVEYECKFNTGIKNRHQLHFSPIAKNGVTAGFLVESGNYQSIENLFVTNPAVVTNNKFIDDLVGQLMEITEYLHSQKIYHLCYSPETVLCRKGDNFVMLLSHGSFYLNKRTELFGDYADYVAPEVLSGEDVDERSDIYSLGQFIKGLFITTEMPLKYKTVIAKATQASPEKRYASIRAMKHDLTTKGRMFKTLFISAAVLVVAILGTLAWLDLRPEEPKIEYVKPAPREATDDLLDDGFDPRTELGVQSGVDTTQLTPQQQQRQNAMQSKSEKLFRSQFASQANSILSKVYNSRNMNGSEHVFNAAIQNAMTELAKIQVDLSHKYNLTDARSQMIAADVVDKITEQKMKAMR